MKRKICIINPNTTKAMTQKIDLTAKKFASEDSEIISVEPKVGPDSIEGFYDEAFCIPGLIEEIKKQSDADAYIIACFDDTGLEVDALNGLPGVMSKRFSGLDYSAEKNINKLLNMMKSTSNRKAKFKTVIALILNGELSVFTGICDGEIIFTKKVSKGFWYDPVFKPIGHKFTFAEMDLETKNTIGHRAKAIKKLIEFLLLKNFIL